MFHFIISSSFLSFYPICVFVAGLVSRFSVPSGAKQYHKSLCAQDHREIYHAYAKCSDCRDEKHSLIKSKNRSLMAGAY